jgi:hypothetical protein
LTAWRRLEALGLVNDLIASETKSSGGQDNDAIRQLKQSDYCRAIARRVGPGERCQRGAAPRRRVGSRSTPMCRCTDLQPALQALMHNLQGKVINYAGSYLIRHRPRTPAEMRLTISARLTKRKEQNVARAVSSRHFVHEHFHASRNRTYERWGRPLAWLWDQ